MQRNIRYHDLMYENSRVRVQNENCYVFKVHGRTGFCRNDQFIL